MCGKSPRSFLLLLAFSALVSVSPGIYAEEETQLPTLSERWQKVDALLSRLKTLSDTQRTQLETTLAESQSLRASLQTLRTEAEALKSDLVQASSTSEILRAESEALLKRLAEVERLLKVLEENLTRSEAAGIRLAGEAKANGILAVIGWIVATILGAALGISIAF